MKFFTQDVKLHIISIMAEFVLKINFGKHYSTTALQYDNTKMFGFSAKIEKNGVHKRMK